MKRVTLHAGARVIAQWHLPDDAELRLMMDPHEAALEHPVAVPDWDGKSYLEMLCESAGCEVDDVAWTVDYA